MSTFLFNKIIFGPVFSRRLGVSLGMNLLPPGRKICNFNCVYCECGHTHSEDVVPEKMPSRERIRLALHDSLEEMAAEDQYPDVITFAGNGEPTIHPDFPGIIDDTIEVKNLFFPETEIAVLSNSTTLHKKEIRKALKKIDKSILKLDSAINSTIQIHNQPKIEISADEIIENMSLMEGNLIIQTMFIRGRIGNTIVDNTTEKEIEAWLKALVKIKPAEVQIYTISRDAPAGNNINKVLKDELEQIASRVNAIGFKTQISA